MIIFPAVSSYDTVGHAFKHMQYIAILWLTNTVIKGIYSSSRCIAISYISLDFFFIQRKAIKKILFKCNVK